MIGVVVVTHGQLATELVNATETIVGDLPRFAAVSSAGTKTLPMPVRRSRRPSRGSIRDREF